MSYTKPEVAVLGNAVSMIEQTGTKKLHVPDDGVPFFMTNPAYDLDE
jgi:hypothetical protein